MRAVAENVRPPVAVRIVRPYDTEDALLENELETIGKTSVLLIGAHPRPNGVILRFEVTLASGATVLRGEGRVLAHKENAFRGQAGLALRFTRLDPRSKAVVDRATAIREARAQIDPPAPLSSQPALPASDPAPSVSSLPSFPSSAMMPAAEAAPVAEALSQATPEPAPAAAKPNRPSSRPTRQFQAVRPEDYAPRTRELTPAAAPFPAEAQTATASVAPEAIAALRAAPDMMPKLADEAMAEAAAAAEKGAPTVAPRQTAPTLAAPGPSRSKRAPRRSTVSGAAPAASSVAKPLAAPPDRDALLARLRERASRLPPDRIAEILTITEAE